jgi:hypothetical protein
MMTDSFRLDFGEDLDVGENLRVCENLGVSETGHKRNLSRILEKESIDSIERFSTRTAKL